MRRVLTVQQPGSPIDNLVAETCLLRILLEEHMDAKGKVIAGIGRPVSFFVDVPDQPAPG